MILDRTGFTIEKWEAYHTRMIEARGKHFTHLDLSKPITGKVPSFKPALEVAYAYEEWIKELMRPALTSPCTLSREYEMWKAEATEMVSQFQQLQFSHHVLFPKR
jgi:hypothetical protein